MIHPTELMNPPRQIRGIFYGWWLVGLSAFTMVVGGVPVFQGMSVWNPALKAHFGWTPGQLSVAFAFARGVEGGVMGPVEGLLIQRLGSRRMILIGMLVLGCGFLVFGRIQELWHLYVAIVVVSVGASMGTWLPMMTALNNWFVRRRATAMGWALGLFLAGGVLVMPALAWSVGSIEPDQQDRFGWRTTAQGIGVFILVLAFPVSRLVRNRPEDYGQYPDGRMPTPATASGPERESSAAEGEPEFTWQQALRTRTFWLMSFGHACTSTVLATVGVHLGLVLDHRDFSLQMIGWVVAVYAGVAALFTLVGGHIGDRVPIRMAIFGFALVQSLAIMVLVLAHSPPVAFLFAVLLGIGFGGRLPLVMAVRSVYFGRKSFASITGMSIVPLNLLQIVAPVFAGYMFDLTDSYTIPFTAIGVFGLIGSFLFLLMGDPKPLPTVLRAVGEAKS